MPAINQQFVLAAHNLTALAYKLGIDCPPLYGLNDWVQQQNSSQPASAPASAMRSGVRAGTRTATKAGNFTSATLLNTIGTAPAGITPNELKTMFPGIGAQRIGTTLGHLSRQGKIMKQGNAWMLTSKQAAQQIATA